MHLIHRNRVEASQLNASNPLRCGPPSPAGQGLFWLPLSIKPSKTDTIIAFTVTVYLTQQMRNESLAPLGKIFASKLDRSGSRNEQREFQ